MKATTASRNIWKSWNPKGHNSIKQIASKVTERTTTTPAVDASSLKPGESLRFREASSTVKEFHTNDDRIDFRNGGSVEDKPNESGLLITKPDGSTYEVDGNLNTDTGEPVLHFHTDDGTGDLLRWEQTFPEEGGTELYLNDERLYLDPDDLTDANILMDKNGDISARKYRSGHDIPAERHGDVVAFEGAYGDKMGVKPPVPLEWLISS